MHINRIANDIEVVTPEKQGPLSRTQPGWLLNIFIKPRATLTTILEKDRPAWLLPMLVLTVLAVLEALVFSHLRMTQLADHIRNLPFMQTLSPEEQAFQFFLIGPPIRPLYVYVTPFIYTAGRLWIAWYLLSLVMNLTLTSAGATSSMNKIKNLVAWAWLPLGVRYLIQTASMLITQTAISNRGLSSLLVSDQPSQLAPHLNTFLQSLLGSLDIFFLWVAVLLVLGVVIGFGLKSRGKAMALGLLAVLIALLLMTLSGFLMALLRSTADVVFRAAWYFQWAW